MSGDDGQYDPDARRDTPLSLKLKERIRRDGPISVGEFMRVCLQDTEHGYYRKRAAIGSAGDFITAPEISQVFGELIGLWCVVVWQQMGSPKQFNLIELGPGRGTLMRDALRAARLMPGFIAAVRPKLVETDETLRSQQRATLADAPATVEWVSENRVWDTEPAIVLGNEFLDVEPIDQFERDAKGRWTRRMVGLDESGRLAWHAGDSVEIHLDVTDLESRNAGSIIESGHRLPAALSDLLEQSKRLAALLIDYGHVGRRVGDTLQAVRNHRFEHPLTSPGEADLTAQVDFSAVTERIASKTDLAVDGPITQGEFLGRLGIVERASRLMSANPAKAAELEAGVVRLISPQGMGRRFKAIGVRSRELPALPGFETPGIRVT